MRPSVSPPFIAWPFSTPPRHPIYAGHRSHLQDRAAAIRCSNDSCDLGRCTSLFFKAKPEGMSLSELPRDNVFCNYTILHNEVFVVPDALADRTFAKNPYVVGEPHIRFYAGAPLTIRPGIRLGALCVSDLKPRTFSQHQMTLLRSLGRLVVDELWLHHLEVTGQANTQPLPSDPREPSLDFETWIAPTSAQIRAARGLLNWSTRELADAANISPTSVKRMEIHGETSVRRDSVDAVVLAFQEHGVKFTRAPDGSLGVTLTSSR
ncbi:GAF domain-containing protein [Microvirga yunnanensis]|uniref:GAF domain-containing protein n=1 Tax=Microvirga yunnanensis TaxID=2953740 RepID=UPI0021C978A2|nr:MULTISPECIES: GAF domain-containing protein [unclassified Microvirga]